MCFFSRFALIHAADRGGSFAITLSNLFNHTRFSLSPSPPFSPLSPLPSPHYPFFLHFLFSFVSNSIHDTSCTKSQSNVTKFPA